MVIKSFKGGVHPPHKKSYSAGSPIKAAGLPSQVIIPLSQHTGKPSKAIVKPGEHVNTGTKIAEAAGFISANQHASISGMVKEIAEFAHPVLGSCQSVVIDSDGQDTKEQRIQAQDIIQAVSEAGIVGMGGAAFPTHVKLSPPKGKRIDTLIINGAECEPYLTCDHRLMLERPKEILRGAEIMRRALGIKRCIVAIEDNKKDAIRAIQDEIASPPSGARNDIVLLRAKYPQGAEKQLIKALLDREVPSGGLPFDVGVVVQNAGTALAVYEAVGLGKPLYERVVTISGDCVRNPSNLLVRIGAPASKLIEECGGLTKEPAKIICGGPMMGIAQWTQDFPVIKGTSGVLLLSKEAVNTEPEGVCIRCGRCVSVCPVGLLPTNIYAAAAKERFDMAGEYDCMDCIECGACAFECPAKLDLVGMIKLAKLKLRAGKG